MWVSDGGRKGLKPTIFCREERLFGPDVELDMLRIEIV